MSVAPRQLRIVLLLAGLLLASVVGGCTTPGYTRVKPTPLDQARQELHESQLLDVGVAISAVPPLDEKTLEKQGTTADIRRSESNYVPYHLKSTLQRSSHWGTVQVVPPEDDAVDLMVTSELIKSNGEVMQFRVEAVDATGRRWLRRKYEAKVKTAHYYNTAQGEQEAFQDLYNTVANDLADFKRTLSPSDIEQIRTVSKLKFARTFAPDAYGEYLTREGSGPLIVRRLPADDDPLMERIERIRGRERMFVDTLNQYFEGFYLQMWEPYENWRKYHLAEQEARRQAERDAFLQTIGGALMIAAAVAMEVEGSTDLGPASGILILAGGQIMVNGINLSQQVKLHAAAIQELAESFSAEMQPTVVELEGKRYELSGTASEQYRDWKELLRRIYYEETGFDEDAERFDADEPALDG